jgi:hypothetical protein
MSKDIHVVPLGHILNPSQPVCALSPKCCVLRIVATHANLLVFGLTQSELEPTVYHTRGEHVNQYTTDVDSCKKNITIKDIWYRPFDLLINCIKRRHVHVHIFVHGSWAGFELTTLVVICTDCIGSCISNYHIISTTKTTQPRFISTGAYATSVHWGYRSDILEIKPVQKGICLLTLV